MNSLFFMVILLTIIAHVFALPKLNKQKPIGLKNVTDIPRIIDGQPARAGQFPWQVALRPQSSFCGAALICNSWVLTAAHCIVRSTSYTLHFGSIDQSNPNEPGRVTLQSNQVYVHEQYNSQSLENDVALIKLPNQIQFTDRIKPIRLSSKFMGSDRVLTVSGWGNTARISSQISSSLNYVSLKSIDNEECAKYYNNIKATTLCCKGNPHHSTCHGDSGGPLIERQSNGQYEHVGIVSFVSGAGCSVGSPSGYARTASYLPWIQNKIGQSCNLL